MGVVRSLARHGVRTFTRDIRSEADREAAALGAMPCASAAVLAREASVAIAAASPHRADGFAACRYAIERVKQIVPIWKHEYFEGGDVWIEGATADPDDAEARDAAKRIACA